MLDSLQQQTKKSKDPNKNKKDLSKVNHFQKI